MQSSFTEHRTPVEIIALHRADGGVRPHTLIWEDGERYQITRLIDVSLESQSKVGGLGLRYTCVINDRLTRLYLYEGQWTLALMNCR